MGVFAGGSESKSKTTHTTVSDNAQLISGKGSRKIAQGEGTLIDFQNAKLNTGLQNIKLGKDASLVINQSDPEVLQAALNKISDLGAAQSASLGDYLQKTSEANLAQANSQSGVVEKVLTQIKDLAESKQTDGQSGQNKTVVSVILALVVGAVAFAIFWRKAK